MRVRKTSLTTSLAFFQITDIGGLPLNISDGHRCNFLFMRLLCLFSAIPSAGFRLMDAMKCCGPTGEQGGIDAPVKGGQAPSTFDREREQVNVGEMLGRRKRRKKLRIG